MQKVKMGCYVFRFSLKRVDISSCKCLTERGIRIFLELKNENLEGFKCAHNSSSVTDYSLEPIKDSKKLKIINFSFCNNLTSNILKYLVESECKLEELSMASKSILSHFNYLHLAVAGLDSDLLI